MTTAPLRTGTAALELLRAGRFAEIRDLFAPQLRPMVPVESLQAGWTAALDQYGPVASVGAPLSEPAGPGAVVVKLPVRFERGEQTVAISVTDAGVLTGLQLLPASAAQPTEPWEPPAYADPEQFDEQAVTVGDGPLAVPGTLSLPRLPREPRQPGAAPGPWPAVVLLTGSGPHDRDETIGRNKPFKDLAWGLASRGVAVLRYDKVTYAHPSQLATARDFTVADEYLPHAVAAVHLFQRHPAIDAARVFVLGHSLGGTVAPRVAAAEPRVAGLVVLAGGTQPLHWAAVRQVRHLASLDSAMAAASEATIEALSRQARMIDSPGLSPSKPTREMPFGVPASYWLDLRGYDPVATAAALGKPMLLLQGGRDYQVTVADDLAGWKAGLAGRSGVTIRVYDADNHLFFPGTGPSSPAEYEPAQHLDPAVVADVASWLASTLP